MARQRHLRNAPLIEAIVDFRASLPAGFEPEEFLGLSKELSVQYPKNEARRVITGSFGIEAGKPMVQTPEDRIHGYVYKSEDEKNLAQFRIDGFTFSRLKPYTKWEAVLSEAKRLWEIYCSKSLPEAVTRIAVRYINRLDLPLPIVDFGQYLTAPPRIPDALPQGVVEFFNRIVIREADMLANVIQTLRHSQKGDHVEIIFDIDVYKKLGAGFDMNGIWAIFEQFRVFKNRIFFESITEETARLYE